MDPYLTISHHSYEKCEVGSPVFPEFEPAVNAIA